MAEILAFPASVARRTPCAAPTPAETEAQRSADRVADVLIAIEALRSPADYSLQVIRETGDAEAAVCMRASGGLWWLTPAEALTVAETLRAERAFFGCALVARAFEDHAARAFELDARLAAPRPQAPGPNTQPDPYAFTPRHMAASTLLAGGLALFVAVSFAMSAG